MPWVRGGRICSLAAMELEPSCVLSRTGLETLCHGDPAGGVFPCLLVSSGTVGTVLSMCSSEDDHVKNPHCTAFPASAQLLSVSPQNMPCVFSIITVFMRGGHLRTIIKG